jgi:hypothetical protein
MFIDSNSFVVDARLSAIELPKFTVAFEPYNIA